MLTIEELLGPQVGSYVGFATDPKRRENAASGGVVGAITDYLLDTGLVDGVLASRLDLVDGKLEPQPVLARTSQELKACRNSIYLDFNLGAKGVYHEILSEISTPGRRIAVVGLYCHLKQLFTLMQRQSIPRDRIFAIGLFCSHAPERKLAVRVLERQGADLSKAVAYHTKTGEGYRDGRIYGRSTLEYKDGSKLDFPFIEFTTFKNAWFYAPKKCLVCPDQFSEVADISCGDAWYPEIRAHPVKQTTVVTRNNAARDLVLRMAREGVIELRTVDPVSIVRSQRRVAGGRASLPARVWLAKKWGMKLPDFPGKIRLRDILHGVLIIGAVRVTGKPRMIDFIMRLPTSVVLCFTLLIKVVEQSLLIGLPKGTGVGDLVPADSPTEVAKTAVAEQHAQKTGRADYLQASPSDASELSR